MYINFEIKQMSESFFPYGKPFFSMEAVGPYSVLVDDQPYITKNEKGLFGIRFFEGWSNLPLYEFIPKKYENGEDPFFPFDPYSSEIFKKAIRRRDISDTIRMNLFYETEIKKLRKAIKAIVSVLPKTKDIPEVREFLSYNETIESQIAEFPKEEYCKNIDLRMRNGMED